MGRLIDSIFGLRREERTLALLMALYHVLLLVSLYLLKPVRDSLFLSSRGPAELPFVFLLTAAAVVPVAFFHMRAGRRMNVGPLIDGVSVVLVISLLGLRGLLSVGGEWVTYLLYAWVSIYGLVVTSQFWLLANALFTASQSKRVFTLLSAGAIVGAILGGEITGLLVDGLGVTSENLLWGAGAVLLASTVLGRGIRDYYRQRERLRPSDDAPDDAAVEDAPGALPIIRDSRHVQLIVGTLTVMVVVTTLVDYQFKTVAARAFPSAEALTTFMGHFYGRVSIVALLVQLVVAPRLMRIVGIGGALSVLPGMLALGTVGMLLMPGLVAGVFLRGSGQSLKHSVDKTGRELLFVPLPLEKKKRVKVFIDLFVDQGAQGLGGLLLLGLAYGAGLSVQAISAVTLVLIGFWGVLAYWARHTYVDQFRTKLRARKDPEPREQDPSPGQAASDEPTADVDELLDALCSHAEAEALRALDKLTDSATPVPVDAVLCLLDHPSAAVREEALRVLRVREVPDVGEDVAEALRDPAPDVQLEAARYLYCQLTDNHLDRLRQGLRHDDPQIQAATVGVIAEEGGREEYKLVSERLLRRLVQLDGQRGRESRTQVARILGVLDRPYRNELLRRLLRDDATEVVRAAIEAAGKTGERSFVPILVKHLGDDAFATTAKQALVSYGESIFGTLYDYLLDTDLPRQTRQRIPAIFAARPRQFGLTLLVRSLPQVPVPVRHAVVRALGKVQRDGRFRVDEERVEAAIEREIEHFAALGQVLRLYQQNRASALPMSAVQLRSFREETLERLFRLLGLRYDHRDIYDAYLGITSPDPSLRDSAIEFVDNLVDYNTRRMLLPLLDDPDAKQAVEVGRTFFDRRIRDATDARRYLRGVDDPRLAALLETGEPVSVPGNGNGQVQATPSSSAVE
jgi:ATP/ADP translocase/HEAT repeat protein